MPDHGLTGIVVGEMAHGAVWGSGEMRFATEVEKWTGWTPCLTVALRELLVSESVVGTAEGARCRSPWSPSGSRRLSRRSA